MRVVRGGRGLMDAVPMLVRCHRGQHPEDYGGLAILEPQHPPILQCRYGLSDTLPLLAFNREGYVSTYCRRCHIDHGAPEITAP